MAQFGFFGDQEHRVFNYKPRYYDEEKEQRRRMFGKVDGTAEKESRDSETGEYVPGSYLQGAFRDGHYARKRGGSRAQSIIGIVGLVLVVVVLIYISKFYQLL